MTAPDPAQSAEAILNHDFWSRVRYPADGCWTWTGAANPNGYGTWNPGRKNFGTQYPHRCLWIALNGPIPAGHEVDHQCFNTSCVRPTHLRLLTKRENCQQRRLWLMHKTACPQGHALTAENVYILTRKDGRTYRKCRTCQLASNRRYQAANPRPPEYWRELRRRRREAS